VIAVCFFLLAAATVVLGVAGYVEEWGMWKNMVWLGFMGAILMATTIGWFIRTRGG
jgi:uncharacterized membrane protein (DUF2068 family)